MSNFFDLFKAYTSDIIATIASFKLRDILDIAVVTFIIYSIMKIVRETRAMQFIKSIGVIFIAYFIATEFNIISLKFLLGNVLNIGLVALVVLFQPELRRALERLGRSKISDVGTVFGAQYYSEEATARAQELVEIICAGCETLSKKKIGALIVIERQTKLGEVINSGTIIDSRPSTELIGNIFFTNSPLHDGALVIRNSRLYAAGCFLPLSANMEIGKELGTRHRAALGMSEVSDAVTVVVSEESGAISVAAESRLQRGLSIQNLSKLLSLKLSASAMYGEDSVKKRAFWKVKK